LGLFLTNLKNYDKALEYYKKSFLIARKSTDIEHILKIEANIGATYSRIEQTDSAIVYFKKIINNPSQNKEIQLLRAGALSNLSGLQIQKGDLLHAQINALNALEIHEKYDNALSTARALNNLASVYLEQKRYKDAKRVYFEALSLIKNIDNDGSLSLKESLYDNLSWVLYKLKDYHTYTYQEKSFNIRDSIRNEQLSKILAEIEGRYNADAIKKKEQLKTAEEKREKEHAQNINNILIVISLSLLIGGWLIYRYLKLRQKNLQLELKQQQLIQHNKLEQLQSEAREKILNATLDGKESERKMIAETLHHSVSSLLSSASLHLQASKMLLKKGYPVEIEKAQKIVNEAADKIRNLSHSLVSSVLLKFGLGYAIQDLCDKYSNSSLNFHCDCENIGRYAQGFELKINSIIDELLNNIIKHSNASNAEIKITAKKQHLEITILDDGKGFNPNKNYNISGLGLRQIETRINKMQGVFKINSSLEEGTSIFISVPIEYDKEQLLLN
jgi:signal transduction histidine kinase